jgi:hypothetical protein
VGRLVSSLRERSAKANTLSLGTVHGDGWRPSFHANRLTSAAGVVVAPAPSQAV